jgi:hypothetical protein
MPACAADYRLKRQLILNYMVSHRFEAVVLTARCHFAWATRGGLNHVGTAGGQGNAAGQGLTWSDKTHKRYRPVGMEIEDMR